MAISGFEVTGCSQWSTKSDRTASPVIVVDPCHSTGCLSCVTLSICSLVSLIVQCFGIRKIKSLSFLPSLGASISPALLCLLKCITLCAHNVLYPDRYQCSKAREMFSFKHRLCKIRKRGKRKGKKKKNESLTSLSAD